MDEVVPKPAAAFVARLNAAKGFIASLAALVVALSALMRPTDTKKTEAGYEQTAKAIQKLSEEVVQNHDDIVALRGYLNGRLQVELAEPANSASAPKASALASRPKVGSKAAPEKSSAPPPMPVPPVSKRPETPALPAFNAL